MAPASEEAIQTAFSLLPPAAAKKKVKGAEHASCKTRNQTPRQAQENIRTRQRLFPHKIQALSFSQRGGRARPQVCILRPQTEKAPVSLALDCAHRCRCQTEWDELQPIHSWPEKRRRGTGSQDPCGFGGPRSWSL